MTTKLYARESVVFDHVLTLRDTNGDALNIAGWVFNLALYQAGGVAPEINLGMAATDAQGLFRADPAAGQLKIRIDQATLAGIDDTTGDFTLFGDLLATPTGEDQKFAGDIRLNVTVAGVPFAGPTYALTLDAVGADWLALVSAEADRAEAVVPALESRIDAFGASIASTAAMGDAITRYSVSRTLALSIAALEIETFGTVLVQVPPVDDNAPFTCSDGYTPAIFEHRPALGIFAANNRYYPDAASMNPAANVVDDGTVMSIGPWRDTAMLNAGNTAPTTTAGFVARSGTTLSIDGTEGLRITASGSDSIMAAGYDIACTVDSAESYELTAEVKVFLTGTAQMIVSRSIGNSTGIRETFSAATFVERKTWGATRSQATGSIQLAMRKTGTPAAGKHLAARNISVIRTRILQSQRSVLDGNTFYLRDRTPNEMTGTFTLWSVGNEGAENFVALTWNAATGEVKLVLNSFGSLQYNNALGFLVKDTEFRATIAVKVNGINASLNGLPSPTNTGAQLVPGLRQLRWGRAQDGTGTRPGPRSSDAELVILPEASPDTYLQLLASRPHRPIVLFGDSGWDGEIGATGAVGFMRLQASVPVINLAAGGTNPAEQRAIVEAHPWLRDLPAIGFDMGVSRITSALTDAIEEEAKTLRFLRPSAFTLIAPLRFAAAQNDLTTVADADSDQVFQTGEEIRTLRAARYDAVHLYDPRPELQAEALPPGTALGDADQADVLENYNPRSQTGVDDPVHPDEQPGTGFVAHRDVVVPGALASLRAQGADV